MFVGLLARAYIVWAAHVFLDKPLKINPVIQHRLDLMKAARFGRYVLMGLVRWASCEGIHSLGRTSIYLISPSTNRGPHDLKGPSLHGRLHEYYVFWITWCVRSVTDYSQREEIPIFTYYI